MKSASGTPGRGHFRLSCELPLLSPSMKYSAGPRVIGVRVPFSPILRVVRVAIELEVPHDQLAPASPELQRPRNLAAHRHRRQIECQDRPAVQGEDRAPIDEGELDAMPMAGFQGDIVCRVELAPIVVVQGSAASPTRGPTVISVCTASAPSKRRQAKVAPSAASITSISQSREKSWAGGCSEKERGRPS